MDESDVTPCFSSTGIAPHLHGGFIDPEGVIFPTAVLMAHSAFWAVRAVVRSATE